MKKAMIDDLFFNINDEIVSFISNDSRKRYAGLINNYEDIIKSNLNNIRRMITYEKNKAVIIYNFGLLIELFLKMVIIKLNILNLEQIAKYNHQISNMFDLIIKESNNNNLKKVVDEIQSRSSLIKYSNGIEVNYDEYSNFRYNHKKNDTKLIFIDEISDIDIKYIGEVCECIELVMKC